MLFDRFEAYDVQEIRRVSKAEGDFLRLIKQVCKKIQKGCSAAAIADILEEDLAVIQPIYDIAYNHSPDFDENLILKELQAAQNKQQEPPVR